MLIKEIQREWRTAGFLRLYLGAGYKRNLLYIAHIA